ncbi:hypothetical protein [Sphingomonas alpina]|uniref:Uncharacterized protein n=1 Tax=Sphingomonas alpina TaxID=653931 RepID=A0A7H0LNF6_9SPHN|nr:hypothetical protein [Sphingomonas alpina]QNQ11209.1 hypothetical protein H3Z74_08690 [Sphingomonas alpina]
MLGMKQGGMPSIEYPAGSGRHLVTRIPQPAQFILRDRLDIGKRRECGRAARTSERDNFEPLQIDHRAGFFAHPEHMATVRAAGEDQRALAATARTAWLCQGVMGCIGHAAVPGRQSGNEADIVMELPS